MKTKEEILSPFIERPFRHTEVIEKDNALIDMQMYLDQYKGMTWFKVSDKTPVDYVSH